MALPTVVDVRAREALRMKIVFQLFWSHLGMVHSLRLGFFSRLVEAVGELLQYRDAEYGMAMTLEAACRTVTMEGLP